MADPLGSLSTPSALTIQFRQPSATTQVEERVAHQALAGLKVFDEDSQKRYVQGTSEESNLRVIRGGNGKDYVVKAHEVQQKGSTLKAVAKLAGKAIGTGLFALLHPGTYRAFKKDRAGEKTVEYTTDISDQERATMGDQIASYYTMKLGNKDYDVRKSEQRSTFIQELYKKNPEALTYVRGKGHYYLDQKHARVMIVPDGNDGRPDFSEVQSYHITNLKDVAIKDRLQLERAAFQLLYAQDEIDQGVRSAVDSKMEILLTDASLKKFRREMVARMVRLLGAMTTEQILQQRMTHAIDQEQVDLKEELEWVAEQRKIAAKKQVRGPAVAFRAAAAAAADDDGEGRVDVFNLDPLLGELQLCHQELQVLTLKQKHDKGRPDKTSDPHGAAEWEQREKDINTLQGFIRKGEQELQSTMRQLFGVEVELNGQQCPAFPSNLTAEQCYGNLASRPDGVNYPLFTVSCREDAVVWHWRAIAQKHVDTLRSQMTAMVYGQKDLTHDKLSQLSSTLTSLDKISSTVQQLSNPDALQQYATVLSQSVGLYKLMTSLPDSAPEKAQMQMDFTLRVASPLISGNHILDSAGALQKLYTQYNPSNWPLPITEAQIRQQEMGLHIPLTPPLSYNPVDVGNQQWLISGASRSYQVRCQSGVQDLIQQVIQPEHKVRVKIKGEQIKIGELKVLLAKESVAENKTQMEAQIAQMEANVQHLSKELQAVLQSRKTQIAPYQQLIQRAKKEGVLLQDYALACEKMASTADPDQQAVLIAQARKSLNQLVRIDLPDMKKLASLSDQKKNEEITMFATRARLKSIKELHLEQKQAIQKVGKKSFNTIVIDGDKKTLRLGNESLVYNPKSGKLERSVDFQDQSKGLKIKASSSYWDKVKQSYKEKFNEFVEKPDQRKGGETSSERPRTMNLEEEEKKNPLGDMFEGATGGIKEWFSKTLGLDDS